VVPLFSSWEDDKDWSTSSPATTASPTTTTDDEGLSRELAELETTVLVGRG